MYTFNLTETEVATVGQVLDFARKNCPIEQVRVIVDLYDNLKKQVEESKNVEPKKEPKK